MDQVRALFVLGAALCLSACASTTQVADSGFKPPEGSFEFNFNYIGADEVKGRGRSLLTVLDGKLYFISLDGASIHYFDAALPEFKRIVESAQVG
jgi:hypothetical protein